VKKPRRIVPVRFIAIRPWTLKIMLTFGFENYFDFCVFFVDFLVSALLSGCGERFILVNIKSSYEKYSSINCCVCIKKNVKLVQT